LCTGLALGCSSTIERRFINGVLQLYAVGNIGKHIGKLFLKRQSKLFLCCYLL
jgi:hypothetical protein